MIEVLSLDFSGTIAKTDIDWFWREEIPQMYARHKAVSIDEAKRILYRDYESVGPERPEWYDPKYWLARYGLSEEFAEANARLSSRSELYRDVEDLVIPEKTRLMICSGSWPELVVETVARTRLRPIRVYSPSQFGLPRKDFRFYTAVLGDLNVASKAILHVGDHFAWDFEEPRKAGWHAVLLDREERRTDLDIRIRSLSEVTKYLSEFDSV